MIRKTNFIDNSLLIHPGKISVKLLVAVAILSIGISFANAIGGIYQILFYLACVIAWSISPCNIPKLDVALLMVSAIYITAVKIYYDQPIDSSTFLFFRPCIEGYLIASILYSYFGVRDLKSLASVLGYYILIQVLLAALMFIFPVFRDEILEYIYKDESYSGLQFLSALKFRGFGISSHHLFGFSLAIGVASATYALFKVGNSKVNQVAHISLISLGVMLAVVNARIGLIPFVVTYALGTSLFYNKKIYFQLFSMLLIVAPLIISLGYIYFGSYFEVIINFIGESGNTTESGSLGIIGEMLFLPSKISEVFFGAGVICSTQDSCYSDSGLVRLIFEGGLIFAITLIAYYIVIHKRILKLVTQLGYSRSYALLFISVLLITFVAALTKGVAYQSNDYTRLITTIGYLAFFSAIKKKTIAAPAIFGK